MFSEPKLVIPDTTGVQSARASDSMETKPSGERRPEAESTAAAVLPVSVTAEPPEQIDGRPLKRSRDSTEPADCSTVVSARKKRKGKKSG